MKKILTVFLAVCLLASLATCFAFSSSAAEEIDVTAGSKFEWNDQSGDAKKQTAWRTGKGKSPDGLWQYHFYSLVKKMYQPMVFANGAQYAWTTNPGGDDSGLGYARVRELGKNFHPAVAADVVKTFYCPAGGTIEITSTLARQMDLVAGTSQTGTSFAIYVEDRLVYPEEGGGEFLTLVSTAPQTVTVTVEVAKNERVRFHIGAIGDQGSDGVNMENTIVYKSVDDSKVADEKSDTKWQNSVYVNPDLPTDQINNNVNNNNNNNNNNTNNDGGISAGAIIGIVVGAVSVVGIAVAVVVILKKKKQD